MKYLLFFLLIATSLSVTAQRHGVIQLSCTSFLEVDFSQTRFYQNGKYLGNADKAGRFFPKKKLKGPLKIENNLCEPITIFPGTLGKHQYFPVELEARAFFEKVALAKALTTALSQCEDTTKIVAEPDEEPVYPGGNEELSKFLRENIKYPQTPLELGLEGTVYIMFVVSETGTPTCFYAVRTVKYAPEFTEEALKVLRQLPDFNPAMKDNMPVKSVMLLPVVFKLS